MLGLSIYFQQFGRDGEEQANIKLQRILEVESYYIRKRTFTAVPVGKDLWMVFFQ
jgi:hypothetical protein